MTKAEIVSKISEKTGIEKTTALSVVESFMIEIKDSIKKDESVFLRGFGTFLAKERKEKTGRNISKNTTIIIPAHHIPSFKPAKVFKEEVKNNIK
ncbi:MAG: integration host factor subunit beta [Flavobacteriales bacterium]|jgi:DNA-binding protein HU-beta|nr:integration host factor subunit beta [Flavobacteriales bacterium]MBT6808827.1 integration host factor subunit beta [Flavobacteriales bacterium]